MLLCSLRVDPYLIFFVHFLLRCHASFQATGTPVDLHTGLYPVHPHHGFHGDGSFG